MQPERQSLFLSDSNHPPRLIVGEVCLMLLRVCMRTLLSLPPAVTTWENNRNGVLRPVRLRRETKVWVPLHSPTALVKLDGRA